MTRTRGGAILPRACSPCTPSFTLALAALLAGGVIEQRRHFARLESIPVRVLVLAGVALGAVPTLDGGPELADLVGVAAIALALGVLAWLLRRRHERRRRRLVGGPGVYVTGRIEERDGLRWRFGRSEQNVAFAPVATIDATFCSAWVQTSHAATIPVRMRRFAPPLDPPLPSGPPLNAGR
jgi:hypothetical protein